MASESPEEILERGFRQMESGKYKKSEEQLQPLLDAGKQLGVSPDEVKKLYSDVQVGMVPRDRMSPEQRQQADQAEVEALAPPTLDEPFKFDDLPPLGHLLLHEHRVQREYNRIAAYQLPQLTQFVKPYVPRRKQDVLRFRYATYMGEAHPAEKKVTVSFHTRDLDLTEPQRHKLRVLAGARYNAGTDEVRIAADRYPDQAQNKRFLGQIVADLLAHARDQADPLADVPVDTRHVEPKLRRNKPIYPQHAFPKDWERPQDAPKPKNDLFSAVARQLGQN
ncbi:hypothetical protein TRICI_006571 [Trichomonascus ciferrii]|uniref:Small ribosomal subunit protein mS35 mitochondrial conserved domain-containing protein n=1 Tax=Trichomonascus ciferrii TaxID=44093 RepID=A0A642UG15_9ASCO|nr:hypothetical protein TRICI_006571 [Trichomonascus ciferrii]